MAKMRNIEVEVTEEPTKAIKKTKIVEKTIEKKEETMTKGSFFEAVTGISVEKTPAKTKKNGITTLSLPIALRKAIDEIVAAKKAEKEAKALRETREAEVIDHVMPIYEQDAFDGNFHKSYYISGETETITFVTSDKFSAPKSEEISALQEALGDQFESVIQKEVDMRLKPEIFSNKALQKELMSLIPAERFGEFFVSETSWTITEGFDQKRFSLGKRIYDKVMGILKQAKPSLK